MRRHWPVRRGPSSSSTPSRAESALDLPPGGEGLPRTQDIRGKGGSQMTSRAIRAMDELLGEDGLPDFGGDRSRLLVLVLRHLAQARPRS